MKKAVIALFVLVIAGALSLGSVWADTKTEVCEGLKQGSPSVQCDPDSSDKIIVDTIDKVLGVLSFAIGALSVLMIIFGGFRYVVSGGDSSGVECAKYTILYAIVGLVIAFLARPIIVFVIGWFV